MAYYYSKKLKHADFQRALKEVTAALSKEGFGILSQIDVKDTLKKKLDTDIRPYTILGACNPPYAHLALQAEDKIGTMLPCNVIVQETDNGAIEVSAVDPVASMCAIENIELQRIASEIRDKLRVAMDTLGKG